MSTRTKTGDGPTLLLYFVLPQVYQYSTAQGNIYNVAKVSMSTPQGGRGKGVPSNRNASVRMTPYGSGGGGGRAAQHR